jgi:multidrug resistance efflux pump
VIAEGHLLPRDNATLAFAARGRVEEILVKKGDAVKQGQVLARLGDRQQAEAALTAAQLELTSAQQAYDALVRTADLARAQAWQAYMQAQTVRLAAQLAWDKLDLTSIQTDIDDAQADVTSRQTDVENAQKDFDKYKDLPSDNATRKSYEDALRTAQTNYDQAVQKLVDLTRQRDNLRAALDSALAAEAEAKRTYDNTKNGADSDKLALAQRRLDNAKAQAAAAQNALDNYDLKAPFYGTVVDINISADEWSGPETWAVVVADFSQWYLDTSDLSEMDVVKVAVGQKVTITADALPGVTMTGVVEEIGATPKTQSGDVLYTVHIRMDEVDPLLRWGMTMEVTFEEKK